MLQHELMADGIQKTVRRNKKTDGTDTNRSRKYYSTVL